MLNMRTPTARPARVAKPIANRFIGPASQPPHMGISSLGVSVPRGQVHANQKPNPQGIPWTPNTNLKKRMSPLHTAPPWKMTRQTPSYARPGQDWLSPEIKIARLQTPEGSFATGTSYGGFGGGGGGFGGGGRGMLK